MLPSDLPTIKDGDTIVLDTETNGLSWQVCHTVGFVVHKVDPESGRILSRHYLPIRHESGPNFDPATVIAWVQSWSGKRIHLIGHNLKFDLHFCANDGIHFPNATFEDTQVNATLIDEHIRGGYSLDNISKEYNIQTKKATQIYEYMASKFGGNSDKSQMANYWRLPADDAMAVEYALADGDVTWFCALNQRPIIEYQELTRVWGVECRLIPVLFKMERRGVPVCPDALERLKAYIDRRLQAARALLPTDFNPRSPNQVAAVLMEREGIRDEDLPRTALGNLSFVEAWLKQHDTGRAIINVRQLTNLQNTFIKGSVEDKLHKGRVHCSFNQMFDGDYGTTTGRLSSSQPNMQQVPKRDKLLAPIFRDIYVPEPGTFWSTNDYSQQEYRVFAAYTGSKPIIEGYAAGIDMHQTVANKLGVERDPTGKRLNLGMLYWAGAPKIAGLLGITVERAQELREWYDAEFPDVKKFLYRCQKKGKSAGFIKTILGRRARFPMRDESYKGASRAIQGTCADIVKQKMVEVNDFLESETRGEWGLVLQVHDSLDWYLPYDLTRVNMDAAKVMEDMSSISPLLSGKVPMKVDSETGESWGRASFPKQDWSIYEQEISGVELSEEVDD